MNKENNQSRLAASKAALAWTPAKGAKDALPVFMGYLAVSFSLGIAAGSAGFSAFQALIMSITSVSSSGQYAGILLFSEGAGYIELACMILISNARYLLMSCAFTQKFSPDASLIQRLLIGFGLTDEMFGLGIMTPGYLRPHYMYAAFLTAVSGWALGTVLGVVVGNILPPVFIEAMNVAIFGMFLAIIIPPGKRDRRILAAVIVSFAAGLIGKYAPFLSGLSSGSRVLILTIIIASLAAAFFPVEDSVGTVTCEDDETDAAVEKSRKEG